MSSYANQILTSLSQYNQMSKEASSEDPQESPEEYYSSEGLSHMEKYAMTKVAFEWSNPYDDWIPFNEPDEGEEGYDPYQAALDSGDDPNELRQKGQLQEQYGNFGASTYLNPNMPYGNPNMGYPGGGYPGGGYPGMGYPGGGYPGMGYQQMPYYHGGGYDGMNMFGPSRRDMRNMRQRSNPRNYNLRGNFIRNKDKRKAWRQFQKTEQGDRKNFFKNYGKDPAAPAPAAPAPAAPAAPGAGAGVA